MQQNGSMQTGKALPLSNVSNNINTVSEIWTLMNPSWILSGV